MELIHVEPEEIQRIRDQFQVTEKDIGKKVRDLKQWLENQEVLPKIQDENLLERCLLRNKFLLDKTKQKIEGYFNIRPSHPNLYENYKSMIPSKQLTTTLLLPRLTPRLERVIVWKLNGKPKDYDLTSIVKFNLLLFEVLIRNDYSVGDRFIADFTGHSATSIARNNPILISKFLSLYKGAYSGRFAGCDFINAPPAVGMLLTLLKTLAPAKFFERIRVHKDLDSLHKIVPKDCLPKDYGGTLDSVKNLIGKWDKVFEYHQPIFEENLKTVVSKSKKKSATKEERDFRDLDID